MNIFALTKDPVLSAQQMIDKHVVKMPTESCQMLHTNCLYFLFLECHGREPSLRELKQFHKESHFNYLMEPAMLNHPSTIWARQNKANYMWLYDHAVALCKEYTFRYSKIHGTEKRVEDSFTFSYDEEDLTPISIAMDDSYRLDRDVFYNTARVQYGIEYDEWDFVIESYRHYYLQGKWEFASWKKDRRPEWYPSNWYAKKYNKSCREYNKTNPKYPLTLLEE